MSDTNGSNDNRLPPPAFPPGTRRNTESRDVDPGEAAGPDLPQARPRDPVGSAMIEPDEPMPDRVIPLSRDFLDMQLVEDGEAGEVVGMDLNPHLSPEELASRGDPYVLEIGEAVSKLAEAIRRRGAAGLHASPAMSRFEATLRAYCVGYLAGRRAEQPPVPDFSDALPTDG